MKKILLLMLLAMSLVYGAKAQSIFVKNTTGCTQRFQIEAFDASCNQYVSTILTLGPLATQTYTVINPAIWPTLPPSTATIDAAHIIPPCSSPVPINVSISTCTSGIPTSNKYICGCGEIIISLTVLSPSMNELLFQ